MDDKNQVPPALAEFAVGERAVLLARIEEQAREIARLEGLKPDMPPRPPEGYGLPRYGLRWNGPGQPLAVPMDDGYWTPWHLAALKAQPGGADERPAFEALESDCREVFHWVRGCGAYENGIKEIVRRAKARAALSANHSEQVRDGWVLAPQEIHLSASDIELINGMCGDGNEESGYGQYQDGTLYIGYALQDDGSRVYGLHISCDECPEEGVATLAEFAAAPSAGSQKEQGE